jgi:hypothetical protein
MKTVRRSLFALVLLSVPVLASVFAWGQEPVGATPPQVRIASPLVDSTLSGLVTVSVEANGADGIAGVILEVNGATHGYEDIQPPWRLAWNADAAGPGSHILTVVARDAAGNAVRSAVVPVVVGFESEPAYTPPSTHDLVATADDFIAPRGVSVAFTGTSLLANDSDPQGHAIYVSMIATSSSGGGTIAHLGADNYLYTPASGFTGIDAFIYTIADDFGGTASTTVSVTVAEDDPGTPVLSYPANGAAGVLLTQEFTWSAVQGAEVYALHVGTTPGGFDVVRRGGLTQPAHRVREILPVGVPLYARARARVAGAWRSGPTVTFTAAPSTATLTFPAQGAAGVLLTQDFTWTAVPAADAYILQIGTSPGAGDVMRRGNLTSPAHRVREALPAGIPLYARVRARVGGIWRDGPDVSFTAAPSAASLTYPANGAQDVLLTQDFAWTAVPAVEAYLLEIGTTAGASDVYRRGNLTAAAHRVRAALPAGVPLHARVRAKVGGIWRSGPDVSFTAVPSTATLTSPADGATPLVLPHEFTWTAVAAADLYILEIGTTPGAADVFRRGNLAVPMFRVRPVLPSGVPLYVRVRSRVGGIWRDGPEISFTVSPQ